MDDQSRTKGRRAFLKLAGTSVPAALAATVTGAGKAGAAAEKVAEAGLRKTAHVKKYLESVRF